MCVVFRTVAALDTGSRRELKLNYTTSDARGSLTIEITPHPPPPPLPFSCLPTLFSLRLPVAADGIWVRAMILLLLCVYTHWLLHPPPSLTPAYPPHRVFLFGACRS